MFIPSCICLRPSPPAQALLPAHAAWLIPLLLALATFPSPTPQAGALLVLFQQLPEPFMPSLVSNLLAYSAPSGAQAAVLLSDGMTSCEWATCR
jgi:hypothetical protein